MWMVYLVSVLPFHRPTTKLISYSLIIGLSSFFQTTTFLSSFSVMKLVVGCLWTVERFVRYNDTFGLESEDAKTDE